MMSTIQKRIEDKLIFEPNTGCWLWTGCTNQNGYGSISASKRKSMLAHRAAYVTYKGPIPLGMCVCHTCDTPLCVNPDHLFLGTVGDNVRDRDEKGRVQRGERHVRAKLDRTQVAVLREAFHLGFSRKKIRTYFKISKSACWQIINNQTWKHI